MQEMKTYKRGVGQSYDSSSHFRNEYDEHDGGKLQGEKKRGMCQGFSNILIKKKLIYSRIVVKSMDSEYTGLCWKDRADYPSSFIMFSSLQQFLR